MIFWREEESFGHVKEGKAGILKSSWGELGPTGWSEKENASDLQESLPVEQSEKA